MLYNFLPNALQYLLASFIASQPLERPTRSLTFSLRHEYGLNAASRPVFADTPSHFATEAFTVDTRDVKTHRPQSQRVFTSARVRRAQADLSIWDEDEVVGPDVSSRNTLLMLAKMTSNAYYGGPGEKGWYDLGPEWNTSYPFGWEPDADGFRGHIYATPDNSTVIVSIKGTSAGWMVGGGGPTVKKDKLNDNLLFSCCCARVGPTWWTVCDCYQGGSKCDENCLEKSLVEDSLFYPVGTNLYNNITYLYPNSDIWVIGHSLGGSLASLLGVTFGIPVVAFEAPGEKMAAHRLHLPLPPSLQHITHVYHTADPIPQGACTGVSSICAIGGYALEAKCHLGQVIRYDTVTRLKWSVDSRTHAIVSVIDEVLTKDIDWSDDEDGKEGERPKREVPRLTDEADCVDCYAWEFGNFRNTSLTTGACGH
ncbi:putative lipase atg15 [Steccherinum ochraceum]|uniref:triacylglycerol lipase n=1 Tax=Steccherinum ochraceum TaxID=92696 RepID=A0A4R0RAH7_9APHY|nr:putative lipase atg15 [Steccherinum ochraceum]